MARQRMKLRHPDRSAPSEKTLLDLADGSNLFERAAAREKELAHGNASVDNDGSSGDRILESLLWTISLAMVHFTFDVLVQNQYGRELEWYTCIIRSFKAWLVFLLLFHFLHAHTPSSRLVPFLPNHQHALRQGVFVVLSVAAGCRLIYISNTFGYLAVMKQAPPLGCLWLWAVVELDLALGVASLFCAGVYLYIGDYQVK